MNYNHYHIAGRALNRRRAIDGYSVDELADLFIPIMNRAVHFRGFGLQATSSARLLFISWELMKKPSSTSNSFMQWSA
jgi:hypothetical protein